jgi:hypothetical protein
MVRAQRVLVPYSLTVFTSLVAARRCKREDRSRRVRLARVRLGAMSWQRSEEAIVGTVIQAPNC